MSCYRETNLKKYSFHVKVLGTFVLSFGGSVGPIFGFVWLLVGGLFVYSVFVQHFGELWYAMFWQNLRALGEGGETCTHSPDSAVNVS